MFLITLTYKKPIEVVEQYLAEHRAFLEEGYAKNYLIVSGPQNPRVGGIIIACLKDRKTLEEFIQRDPFYIYDVAEFQITEFTPVKYHKNFEQFI